MIHLDLRYIEFAMHRVQYAVILGKEYAKMKNYEINLEEMEEMLPLESPTCIIGPWFFVHK